MYYVKQKELQLRNQMVKQCKLKKICQNHYGSDFVMVLFFMKLCYNETSLEMWKKDCAYESISENKKTVVCTAFNL